MSSSECAGKIKVMLDQVASVRNLVSVQMYSSLFQCMSKKYKLTSALTLQTSRKREGSNILILV